MKKREMKRDFSSIGGRMLIGTIIIIVLQVVCQVVVSKVKPAWTSNYDIMLASSILPMYLLGYPITFLLMKKGEEQHIERHRMSVGQILIASIICYGIMMVGNLLGLGVTSIIGVLKGGAVTNVLGDVVSNGSLWMTAILTVIAAPVIEELLFRKMICGRLVKYGQGVAIVISGLIFGLFHLNFNQFFYAFFIGMFFGFIYVKTGEVKYTIIIHMIVNFVGSVLGGLLMSYVDQESLVGLLIYGVYAIIVYAIAITGIVLFFVFKSKMKLDAGQIIIEKKDRFSVTILNIGMALYCLFCLGYMIYQSLM